MQRPDGMGFGYGSEKIEQALQDAAQGLAKGFAAVKGYEDEGFRCRPGLGTFQSPQQGVDPGVACDVDLGRVDSLGEQVLLG